MSNADPQTQAVEAGEEKPKTTPPPFSVLNRSRAQRIARVLYGPSARVWLNREWIVLAADGPPSGTRHRGVQIGTEVGNKKNIRTEGKDFSEALRTPVEQYMKGASSYADTKKRIRQMGVDATVAEFVIPALEQFPEYKAEIAKLEKEHKEKNDPFTVIRRLLDNPKLNSAPIPVVPAPVIQEAAQTP